LRGLSPCFGNLHRVRDWRTSWGRSRIGKGTLRALLSCSRSPPIHSLRELAQGRDDECSVRVHHSVTRPEGNQSGRWSSRPHGISCLSLLLFGTQPILCRSAPSKKESRVCRPVNVWLASCAAIEPGYSIVDDCGWSSTAAPKASKTKKSLQHCLYRQRSST
jgi:hypothetical protein